MHRSDWNLWAAWALATAATATLGLILSDALVVGSPDYMFRNDNEVVPLCLWGSGLVVLVGLPIGFAQSWVLQRWHILPHQSAWVIASGLAVFLSEVLLTAMGFASAGDVAPLAWLLWGFILGPAQWLVLQAHVRVAGWWIVINGIGGIAAVTIAQTVLNTFVHWRLGWAPFYPFESAVYWAGGWALGAAIFGVITGFGLIWLRHRSATSLTPNP